MMEIQNKSTAFAMPSILSQRRQSMCDKRCISKSMPQMSSVNNNRNVSRRDVGKLILGVSTAAVVTTCFNNTAAAAAQKAPSFVKDDSGILYYDVKTGNGSYPLNGDFVIIDYMAFLSDGTVFDTRKGFVFQMGQLQVIPGLEAAVASMKQGGVRRVVVPASLAYGEKGVCLPEKDECLVPSNERLGYDLTLQRVAVSPT